MVRARRMLGLVAAVCLAATLPILVTPSAQAASTTPFAARKTFNDNGAIALIGNTLLTCPTSESGCAAAKAGTGSNLNNNSYTMTNVDLDSDSSTFNSSNSQLLLPGGSSVLWAGLYWGARLDGGDGGHVAPSKNLRNQMSLRGPTDSSYQTITADVDFGPNTSSDNAYQEFADVTSIVRPEGAGTWWGANVQAGTGKDRYAGWTLVVAYRNPALPLRNLTVFDGFNLVSNNNPQTITISGFLAPQAGPVQTELGMVAYEGDLAINGDTATLTSGSKSTQLSTGVSPANNFFNSSNGVNGANVTTRDPNDRNMFGVDIKDFGAPNTIPNGARSATIALQSTGDTYFPGVVTTAIDLFAPDFTSSAKTVTDVDGNDPAGPGDTLQYTVNLTNTGGDPANNAVLTDGLPPNTTYVPGSLAIANGPGAGPQTDAAGDDQAEYLPATRTVRFRLGTGATATTGGVIDVNAATAVSFQVTVDTAAADTTIANQSSLSYVAATLNQPFRYVTNAAQTSVQANADLVVSKTGGPFVDAGEGSLSRITVRNNGPNVARNAQVSDQLPADVTFVSATPSVGTCTQAAGTVTCALGDLDSGESATVRVFVQVPADSSDASITDVATASSDTNDPNLRNNTAGATVGVGRSADLEVTKTASPSSVAPGEQITFAITVHNNGPSDARAVTIGDTVDSAQLVVRGVDNTDDCTASLAGFSCGLDSLAAGASFTVHLFAAPPRNFSETSVSNTASVAAQTLDPVPNNNDATATVAVTGPRADVAIAKSAAPTSVAAGGRVVYTLTVSNPDGPSNAHGVQVTDALPSGLDAVQAVSDAGDCDLGPPVTCTVDTLTVGGTATITITAAVSPDIALGTVSNTATVRTLGSDDPDTSNNTDSANITVRGEADVSITKTGTGAPVAGEPIDYTLTVSNAGPSRARGVTVSDTLPASLTGITASAGCSVAGQAVTCTAAQLAVDGTATFTVHATVVTTFPGGNIANTATVATTGTTDPDPDNNTADFTSTVSAAADLSISKGAPDSATAGGTLTYTLTVANAGPSAAASTTVTDTLPAGLTAISASPQCSLGPPVTCDLGTVDRGATVTLSITARVDPGVDSGTVATNTASVSSATTDPTTSNNTDSASTTIETSADLQVSKTLVTAPPLAPGQVLVFRIVVHNAGPSDAHAITLRDGLTVRSDPLDVTINGESGIPVCALDESGQLVCQLGDLAAGGTTTVDYTVLPDPGAALGTPFENDAFAAAQTPDPNLDDNSATAPFEFERTEADLAISKTGDADLVAGGPFSYTITVDNTTGPSNAQDVVVTDTLPAGLTAVQAQPTQGSCTIAGAVVTCDLGTVSRLSQPVITLTGTVDSGAAPGPVTNTATVTTSTTDPNADNDTATFDSTISTQANLGLTKTADSDPLIAGTTVGYTLTVTNAGPSDAGPVTLTDVLPAAIAFDPTSSDRSCTQAVTVTCALGTIRAGTTRVVIVSGQLDAAYSDSTLTNTASVRSPVDDPDDSDNTAAITSDVEQQADLSVTKIADATTPAAGSDLTYAISVVNNGPSDAVNATFTDPLPLPPSAFVLPDQGDATCALDGLTVRCTVPRLPAGESRTGQITVHLPADHPPGVVSNTATVSSDTTDPDPTNNEATAPVDVVLVADLTVTKSIVTDPVVAGAPVTYRLDVTNHGPSIAPNTLISDPLSDDVSFVSASGGCAASASESGGTIVDCPLGTLPVGGAASATITVLPHAGATGVLTNTANVGAGALDPAPDDNTATVTAPITSRADLAVEIAGPAKLDAGGSATYHLGYRNNGPSNATNVVIATTLPPGLTPHPPRGCAVSGRVVTCHLAALAAGATGGIDLPVTVDPTIAAGTILVPSATIAADQSDPKPANNTSSVSSTVVRVTDVGVTVSADVPTVQPSGTAPYTVTVTNHGPLPASVVTLTNVLPAQVTDPADPTSCTFHGNTATCTLGTLAPGATVAIPFRGHVPTATPAGTKLTDTASVTRAETDPVAANNRDQATITVVASAPPPAHGNTGSSQPLATTGENLRALIETALYLIALGAALVIAARHRRRTGN